MSPNEIHQQIAAQIDNMLPAHLKPGVDVGMEVVDENALRVIVVPTGVAATVRYLPRPDLYNVLIVKAGEVKEFDRVYCDQLGELIFGIDAQPWTLPMGGIITVDHDGNIQTELF